MDILAPLFAYCVALGIAAVIPGPGVAALVGQSLGGGLRTSLFFLAGITLGDVFYLTVAVAGLATIAKVFAGAFLVIKVLGAAYLLYLGYKFWKNEAGLNHVNKAQNSTGPKAFLAGFTITLGNPKTIIFYLALLPTVLDLNTVGLLNWVALSILTVIVLFVVLTPYAVLASHARQAMSHSGALLKLNRFAASVIGGAGVYILGQTVLSLSRRT